MKTFQIQITDEFFKTRRKRKTKVALENIHFRTERVN